MRRKLAAALVALGIAGIVAGGAIAYAGGGDGEGNASGHAADKARVAALEATGGGTANTVERDGEDGATWEVEVRRPDGSVVDVRLDSAYNLVVIEGDSESLGEAFI